MYLTIRMGPAELTSAVLKRMVSRNCLQRSCWPSLLAKDYTEQPDNIRDANKISGQLGFQTCWKDGQVVSWTIKDCADLTKSENTGWFDLQRRTQGNISKEWDRTWPFSALGYLGRSRTSTRPTRRIYSSNWNSKGGARWSTTFYNLYSSRYGYLRTVE